MAIASHQDERISLDVANLDEAFMADSWDVFTLDATIIATGFGQLIDEGRIDASAKPFLHVALARQLHPELSAANTASRSCVPRCVFSSLLDVLLCLSMRR